ncbi:protein of unknown function DUF502 [Alkaliphilus metalliredigens QYMF]|uniref:DUF502 domain-containing protein n=2 Tax=Alkaliphilus TaxID=114627 RepID=A6TSK1_ALKMQ|nr:protein of unknown function DUF502 [Alkaliphilus metalliredigens QYMF]
MWKYLRRLFFTGLLILFPLAATMTLLVWIFNRIDLIFRRPIEDLLGFTIYGLGFFLTLALIVATGAVATNYLGIKLISFTEGELKKIPLVGALYFSLKQLTETVYGSKHTAFRQAALVQYPSPGILTIGFITAEGMEKTFAVSEENLVSLFIPTTPNPTSGMLVMIPKKELILLDITVEEAIKLVVSGGIMKPTKVDEVHKREDE